MKISIIIPSSPARSTTAVLANLHQIKPPNLDFEIFIIKGTWPPAQRNLGIKKATGEYIFFFDDDIIIPAGAIESAIKKFESNPKIDVVGGPNLTPPQNSFLQKIFGYAHSSAFVGLGTAIRYKKSPSPKKVDENHLITCNLGFRSEIIKTNLFNPGLYANEENELLGRLTRKGHKLAYESDFFIYHHRRKSLQDYLKQIFAWGEGRMIHTLLQPSHLKITFFVPLFFLIYLLSLIVPHQSWYNLPIIIYFLLNIIFSLETAIKHRNPAAFFLMPPIFLLTHIAYAMGLFHGIKKNFSSSVPKPDPATFQIIKIDIN